MSDLTVQELIDRLSQYDGDAKVRVAGQPSYPMEVEWIGTAEVTAKGEDSEDECSSCMDRRVDHVEGGCSLKDLDTDEPCDCEGFEADDSDDESGVWLVVGDNIGYGVPREVYDEARYGF